MKTSEVERSAGELPVTGATPTEESNRREMQSAVAPATTSARRRPLASNTRSDWPLPPPISDRSAKRTATPRPGAHEEAVDLSPAELEMLTLLQARCKELGVKIKKNKLLGAGLQLLAGTPTGKLLAILGPLESCGPLKIKKRKPPVRA